MFNTQNTESSGLKINYKSVSVTKPIPFTFEK